MEFNCDLQSVFSCNINFSDGESTTDTDATLRRLVRKYYLLSMLKHDLICRFKKQCAAPVSGRVVLDGVGPAEGH